MSYFNSNSVHFIAEAGINHNGDLELAKRLMDMAKSSGSNSVKFQKRNPDVCVPEHQKAAMRETPWGEMTYLQYKWKIEFGLEQYQELDTYAKLIGIDWSASAWDLESLEFLEEFDLPYHKVASALNTNIPFLKAVAKTGRPVVLSTGMATIEQIKDAIEVFQGNVPDLVVLHTVSTYPAKEEHLNLKFMQTLGEKFSVKVGYSGHESSLTPSLVAAVLGASVIERHITLDRSMWGTDHSASLEPEGLGRLINMIRKVPVVMGTEQKLVVEEEASIAKKMRYWEM